MNKSFPSLNKFRPQSGFSLPELIVSTAIIGALGAITYPNYVDSNNKAKLSDAVSTMASIPPIIGAFVNETGEAPSTWDDLSNIAAVMTNNGPATGDLETPITLPNSIYDLSIERLTESVYTMIATRVVDRVEPDTDEENENTSIEKYKFAIKSCFNISNGASDLKSGNLSDLDNTLNCG